MFEVFRSILYTEAGSLPTGRAPHKHRAVGRTKGKRAQELPELLLKDSRPNPDTPPCFTRAEAVHVRPRRKAVRGRGSAATLAGGKHLVTAGPRATKAGRPDPPQLGKACARPGP